MNVLFKKIADLSAWQFIVIFLSLCLASAFPVALIEYIFGLEDNMPLREDSFLFSIIFTCIFIPIFETYCLQYLPIYLTNRFISKNWSLQVLISAIIFGILHHYSILYIIYAVINGLILGLGFVAYYHTRGFKVAFWSIVCVHGLRNIIAVTLSYYDI